MARSIFRLVVVLGLLFAGALAAIHAQPYDDGGLHSLLDSACATPCFIGIQPGVTDLLTVNEIMGSHPWITTMRYSRGMAWDSGLLTWKWSGAQPEYINPNIDGKLWIQNDRVQWIEIATRYTFGELWLTQPPESGSTTMVSGFPIRLRHEADYGMMVAHTEIDCPLQPLAFWYARVVFRAQSRDAQASPVYHLPRWRNCP